MVEAPSRADRRDVDPPAVVTLLGASRRDVADATVGMGVRVHELYTHGARVRLADLGPEHDAAIATHVDGLEAGIVGERDRNVGAPPGEALSGDAHPVFALATVAENALGRRRGTALGRDRSRCGAVGGDPPAAVAARDVRDERIAVLHVVDECRRIRRAEVHLAFGGSAARTAGAGRAARARAATFIVVIRIRTALARASREARYGGERKDGQ